MCVNSNKHCYPYIVRQRSDIFIHLHQSLKQWGGIQKFGFSLAASGWVQVFFANRATKFETVLNNDARKKKDTCQFKNTNKLSPKYWNTSHIDLLGFICAVKMT